MICCPSAVNKCPFKRTYYYVFGKECLVFGSIICCSFRMKCLAPYTVPLGPNTALFCYQIKTPIDKIVHYNVLLLILSVFELVYLGSEVKQKVTLFCTISILVLLTHIYTKPKKNHTSKSSLHTSRITIYQLFKYFRPSHRGFEPKKGQFFKLLLFPSQIIFY